MFQKPPVAFERLIYHNRYSSRSEILSERFYSDNRREHETDDRPDWRKHEHENTVGLAKNF